MSVLQRAFLLSFGVHLCLMWIWPMLRHRPKEEKKVLAFSSFRIEASSAPKQIQKNINHAAEKSTSREIREPAPKNLSPKAAMPPKKASGARATKAIKRNENAALKKSAEKELPQNEDREKQQAIDKESSRHGNQESKEASRDAMDGQTRGAAQAPARHLASAQVVIDGYRQRLARRLSQAKFYPRLAQRRGMEGKVMVRFVIERSGAIQSVWVEKSSGYAILDEAAVEAVRKMSRFEPFPQEISAPRWEVNFAMAYQLTD